MKKILSALLFAGVLALVAACMSNPARTSPGILATRYQDIEAGKLPPGTDTFGPGEIPTIYIHGYAGQTVRLRIVNVLNGAYFDTETWYIPKGQDWFHSFDRLLSGTYKAELLVSDEMMSSCVFRLSNPKADQEEAAKARSTVPTGLFVFNKWVDLNADGSLSRDELFGLGKIEFDLNREQVTAAFISPNGKAGELTFQTWTNAGKMIGETKCYLEAKRLQWRMAGPGLDATQGDFMDKLKEAGPGTYRIVALFEGQAYSLDISVVAHP